MWERGDTRGGQGERESEGGARETNSGEGWDEKSQKHLKKEKLHTPEYEKNVFLLVGAACSDNAFKFPESFCPRKRVGGAVGFRTHEIPKK